MVRGSMREVWFPPRKSWGCCTPDLHSHALVAPLRAHPPTPHRPGEAQEDAAERFCQRQDQRTSGANVTSCLYHYLFCR